MSGPSPLTYPRNQRLFLLALLCLGALFLSFTWLSNRSIPAPPPVIDPDLQRAAAALRQGADAGAILADKRSVRSFPFDPNTVTRNELLELGLSDKQAAGWLKYRGDRTSAFRQPEDIGRLYVLTEEDKERLIPLATINKSDAPPTSNSQPGQTGPYPYDRAGEGAPPQRFPFDPNTISADSLQLLGLSEKQAASFLKYRSFRERTFDEPADLLRFKYAKPELLAELQTYVRIAPAPEAGTEPRPATYGIPVSTVPPPGVRGPDIAPASFDINATEVADWLIFPGIGDYRAERIVKFRNSLGGFTDVDQVGTAYALPDSLFRLIRPYLTGGGDVTTISINRAEEADLSAHPYISRKLAAVIVRYRQNHGPFTSVADLSRIRILDAATTKRIAPYLDFRP